MGNYKINSKELPVGAVLRATDGQEIRIISMINRGGQGIVYKVKYCGEEKALKWYTMDFFDEHAFKENLRNNIKNGSPAEQFVWPLAMTDDDTQRKYGSFGYIMDLLPPDYYEVNKYISQKVFFPNYQILVQACIRIIYAFMILHSHGYAYQDINGGNFAINPKNGSVKILDNDNVAPENKSTGILGTYDYMAPEVVRRDTLPNVRTDYHSLAVLLFKLICMDGSHPLLGMHWKVLPPILTREEIFDLLIGHVPVFMFDPDDRSNGPVPGIHNGTLELWIALPEYVKTTFINAFSQDALLDSNRRVTDREWLKVMCQFRSGIGTCTCGSDVFIKDDASTACDTCGKTYLVEHTLKLPNNKTIPVINDGMLFKCQLGTCKLDESIKLVARIGQRPTKNGYEHGLRNETRLTWDAVSSSGNAKEISPTDTIRVQSGAKFKVNDKWIYIK